MVDRGGCFPIRGLIKQVNALRIMGVRFLTIRDGNCRYGAEEN